MSDAIQTKRCSKCKEIFPVTTEYFHRNRTRKDGLGYLCKQCQRQCQQSYKEQNRQAVKRFRQTIRGHLQRVWHNMLRRCKNPKFAQYKDYGGRGIRVNFASFQEFHDYVVKELKADPRGLTIDRINNDGHYEKGNIRFITHRENCQNRYYKKENKNG